MPTFFAVRLPRNASEMWIFLGISGVFIGGMIATALWHRSRRKKLADAMQVLGLAIVEHGEPERGYVHRQHKGQKDFKIRVCGVGTVGRRAVRAVDFTYITGSGKSRRTYHNLQVSFDCPLDWPPIWLGDQPEFMHRPLSQLFGGAGNASTPDAAFNKRWTVSCENHAMPATLLTSEVRELLMQGPKCERWAIADGWVTCTWRKAGTMKDLRQITERAQQLLNLAEHALSGGFRTG